MTTDDVIQFLNWRWDAIHVAALVAILGRLYHAAGGYKGLWSTITSRGGIVGLVKALLFGTNAPPPSSP